MLGPNQIYMGTERVLFHVPLLCSLPENVSCHIGGQVPHNCLRHHLSHQELNND